MATWEENTFDVVCVMLPVDTEQELIEIAYKLTYGLANQMLGMEFDFCFTKEFTFIASLMNSDESWAVRAFTPGDVLKMLVDKQVDSVEGWRELVSVESIKADN